MVQIYKGNILFTKIKDKFEIIENGFIIVKNGKILDLYKNLPSEYQNFEVIDFSNNLIIPGMNDLHCHAPQFRNLGMAMDKELIPWLDNYTFPEEGKFKSIEYSDKVYKDFIKEVWRHGTTRIAVFATVHKESSIRLMDLFKQSGLGALVGKVNMNINCTDDLLEDTEKSISDTEYILENYYNADELVNPIITPRFIPSCNSELLKSLGDLAIKYNVPTQSHLSENLGEIDWVKQLQPESEFYGDAYNRFNLFGQTKTLMAHCVYSCDKELELMKKNNVFAVHCPNSNLNLGSGIMPVRKFLDNDINIALGSDISGGHDLSIFKVMVNTIQCSKLLWVNSNKQVDFLTLSEAFYMATKGGGSFFGKVGSFEKNYDFDALVLDDSNLNPESYSLIERLERFIYIGDDRNIIHRYVRGEEISDPKFY
ncbi:guanine deaminase [Paraclostridium bifermentans]|uniref:amidohydrolase family protein n=1 Tax=Paraclostridium bifermentans TaxID=1490 RepID=UPI00038C6C1C|nr:amidohydrolase family protein [Paraclostridium bifermentans]EQK39165.1 amidohydrolase family protein [[Clostridium] bifermentans ATCC 19299] [Paraclostridium bifermentans ATCC 19299]GKZ08550.1 guanine deaminase [Paraclostridium bifermentans]GKZ09083.1 guanine deaminase [Paraclostridium bifermentans]